MQKAKAGAKVAFVHEWFQDLAGSESVLEQMLLNFPDADVFALVDYHKRDADHWLSRHKVTTTWLQRLPFGKYYFRLFLPFFPHAIQSLDLKAYDLVISNSHCVAKQVLTGPDQVHICLCHSPMRYAYDMRDVYFSHGGVLSRFGNWLRNFFLARLRISDVVSSNSVDHFIAISDFVRRRIWKYYRRDSTLIHSPIDFDKFHRDGPRSDDGYYVTVGRLVRYKNVHLLAKAFAADKSRRLKIVGQGEMASEISAIAQGAPNIEMLGYLSDQDLQALLKGARAFLFASIEDLGLAPLEAQAAGIPCIAYGRGGALDTIRGAGHEKPSGVFFYDLSTDGILAALSEFEASSDQITADNCRENARRFSRENFQEKFRELVERVAPSCVTWKA